jgi:uncharacterized protein (TIGR04552 family)
VREVWLWASQYGGFRRTQILSCVILKLMHVIHHLEAADLKFKTPISEQRFFELAHGQILTEAQRMQEDGLPVVSFHGSRKSRSSIISKLLAKKEALATTIFDKLRFRIVVQKPNDLVPVMAWLGNNVFAYSYSIPGQTHNNLLNPGGLEHWLRSEDNDRAQTLSEAPAMQETLKNTFSGASYRMINFIVDYPVRVPGVLGGTQSFELGKVVFVMVEFQLLDEETARRNEAGENSHYLYKERQHAVVAQRLKRGGRGRKKKPGPED